MADVQQFDVLIIGSGPGGYVGAIRAGQLGFRTACVEKMPTLGGTCLNVGCIPSKALLDSSEWFSQAKEKFAHHGVVCNSVTLDLPPMMKGKDKVVEGLTKGIDGLFKKNKVTRINGLAHFRDARTVTVTASDGTTQDVQARAIVIATGSEPIPLPTVPFDGERIVSSTEALAFSEVPKHLVVIGGGAIGLELGSVWLRLGAKVTVVELLPRLVPGIDTQIASALQRSLTKQGFSFMLGSKVTQAAVKNGEVTLTVENDKKELKELTADRVLVAVGRKAYTNGLGAAEIGVDALPVTLVVRRREAGQTGRDAALDEALLLDGVERAGRSRRCCKPKRGGAKNAECNVFHDPQTLFCFTGNPVLR